MSARASINKGKGGCGMSILAGKKVIIIGDRDGVPGQAIELCAKSAGADVVFSSTECFV
jgi:glycine reductase